jgi:hypothetical protein
MLEQTLTRADEGVPDALHNPRMAQGERCSRHPPDDNDHPSDEAA